MTGNIRKIGTKNIGIDGNEANITTRVGVGQYAYNIICKLYRIDTQNNYYIYLKNSPLADMPPARTNWHYRVFGPGKLWTKFALPLHLYIDRIKLDLFYSPSHYSPHFSPFPTIPTIHDLGYLKSLKQFNKKDIYQLVNWTNRSIQHAKHIIAVSQFTKNDIAKTYLIDPQNISVVYNGVDQPPSISESDYKNVLSKFKIIKPYFLALGTLKPNKNYPFLIKSFAYFLRHRDNKALSCQLVIAGKKGWLFDQIFETVKNEKLEDQVIFTDYITETEKWTLLKLAVSLVIPSTYEGFGIPAIESQISGTPVIASDIPSIHEVLDNSALYINPTKENSLIVAFSKIQDPKLRPQLIRLGLEQSKKFSWENSAKALIEVLNAI
jgi:glycosyltransferase involved in cell wall biosynthesis